MKLSDINPNPKNPRLFRRDRLTKLMNSIKEFPKMMSIRPIVVDETNTILGGNLRYAAIKALKMDEFPDDWVIKAADLTNAEKKRFVIADNVEFVS